MAGKTLEAAVEQAAITLFLQLGWTSRNLYHETYGDKGTLGREHAGEVVLRRHLRAALQKLNPSLPPAALNDAIDEICRDRSAQTLVAANRDLYLFLRDGVPVRYQKPDGTGEIERFVQVIDWDHPDNNDLFLGQQLWVQGPIYNRRADLVGFVNGLPLIFIELKSLHQNIKKAYDDNFTDYLTAIPQLFWYNAVCILSNGLDGRAGSLNAPWDHFKRWKRPFREDEKPTIGLEPLIRGTCTPARLLDLVQNFVLFSEKKSATAKILGQNHQVLGVNRAFEAVRRLTTLPTPRSKEDNHLGMFWHTQGSGKSYSMVFFAQKVLRQLPGGWTFVVITDREDLDRQIYKTFAACDAVKTPHVQAQTAEHLKQLLSSDHTYVFTLIQKFRTDVKGKAYPVLSTRSNIIVMADEAHRSQYDTFARNLRNALPNAAFIGFTGTPLMEGELTREFFGDYVSQYNFRQAIEDEATVPLYYEARVPELHLRGEDLNAALADVLDEEDLTEEQQRKVEREFARQYHLITRKERLDTIAADLVKHLMGLPVGTKAMVVSVDKVTAGSMHQKVQAAWRRHRDELQAKLTALPGSARERDKLQAQIAYMDQTDMALVVSQSQNEVAAFKKKGLDIAPHRQRMLKEDLDTKFKDEKDPLRVVFVCAMWMTGFDVPSCGVVYLDKPMRNHTLMQTIARANRVFEDKQSGLIVDYIGVFQDLKKALGIYGASSGGGVREGDCPAEKKDALVDQLVETLAAARQCCQQRGVDLLAAPQDRPLSRLVWLGDAIDKLIRPEDVKKEVLALAYQVDRLFSAVGLDPRKEALAPQWGALQDLAGGIRAQQVPVDISEVMARVEGVLDEVIGAERPQIYGRKRVHLGRIDFEALTKFMASARHKASAAATVLAAVQGRVDLMVRMNPVRQDLRAQLERLIAEYNSGAQSAGDFFDTLLEFMRKIEEEAARAQKEQLDEETLALLDVMVGLPAVKLSEADRKVVKQVARDLPGKIAAKLVIDWRGSQRARAAVRVAIQDVLEGLPEAFGPAEYEQLCQSVFDHVFESYYGEGKSKYQASS